MASSSVSTRFEQVKPPPTEHCVYVFQDLDSVKSRHHGHRRIFYIRPRGYLDESTSGRQRQFWKDLPDNSSERIKEDNKKSWDMKLHGKVLGNSHRVENGINFPVVKADDVLKGDSRAAEAYDAKNPMGPEDEVHPGAIFNWQRDVLYLDSHFWEGYRQRRMWSDHQFFVDYAVWKNEPKPPVAAPGKGKEKETAPPPPPPPQPNHDDYKNYLLWYLRINHANRIQHIGLPVSMVWRNTLYKDLFRMVYETFPNVKTFWFFGTDYVRRPANVDPKTVLSITRMSRHEKVLHTLRKWAEPVQDRRTKKIMYRHHKAQALKNINTLRLRDTWSRLDDKQPRIHYRMIRFYERDVRGANEESDSEGHDSDWEDAVDTYGIEVVDKAGKPDKKHSVPARRPPSTSVKPADDPPVPTEPATKEPDAVYPLQDSDNYELFTVPEDFVLE